MSLSTKNWLNDEGKPEVLRKEKGLKKVPPGECPHPAHTYQIKLVDYSTDRVLDQNSNAFPLRVGLKLTFICEDCGQPIYAKIVNYFCGVNIGNDVKQFLGKME